MVKFIITIFCLCFIWQGAVLFLERNEAVSYNKDGNKIVRVECSLDKEYDCTMIIGKHCGKAGFKEILREVIDSEQVITAVCGEDESILSRVF